MNGIERLRQKLTKVPTFHQHWVVVEQAGGLIQRLESCMAPSEVAFVEVDFDELDGDVSDEEALEYYTEGLANLREFVAPGNYRKYLRRRMAQAIHRGQGYYWAYPGDAPEQEGTQ